MDEIREIAIPMHGRYIHNIDGTSAYQPYGKQGQFINSVSRGELNRKLMDLAEEHGVKFFSIKNVKRSIGKKTKSLFELPGRQTVIDSNFRTSFGC